MNLDYLLSEEELLSKKHLFKKIFFYRICGTGMGACACLFKESGLIVEGADQSFSPPMSTYLESTGIPCHNLKEIDDDYLRTFDLIIVGNSVPRDSEQALNIEKLGIPFTSFPAALGAFILKERTVIGVAGTHGKTTTTFFLTLMLEYLGEAPGYFIGGVIDGRAPSRLGTSKYFTIESDEYDSGYFHKISKFRYYELDKMILTSLEFDHADIFNSVEDIKEQFRPVLKEIGNNVVADASYNASKELATELAANWQWYHDTNGPKLISLGEQGTNFELLINDEKEQFQTNIIGMHNIQNISACILLLIKEGFDLSEIKKSILNLGLVKRRQELRGHYKGAAVIDDFAHHPKAITVTINAIKDKFPGKSLIVVFEAVSATARSSCFQEEFAVSLEGANKVILARHPLHTTAKKFNDINHDLIKQHLESKSIETKIISDLPGLLVSLENWANKESVIAILSNRTCLGLWESEFVKNLT